MMASTVEGQGNGALSRPALDARSSYVRVAERYEAMALAAEGAGDAVRAANQRQAAATFRALAITPRDAFRRPISTQLAGEALAGSTQP
jgi:hypothetical protein